MLYSDNNSDVSVFFRIVFVKLGHLAAKGVVREC